MTQPRTIDRSISRSTRHLRGDDQQQYQDYLAGCVGPSIHALNTLAVCGAVVIAVTGTLAGHPSLAPAWLQALPLVAMLGVVAATKRVRQPDGLRLLGLVAVTLLEVVINLQGLTGKPDLPWVWPGALLVPAASAMVWLGSWDFALGMLLCALGPLPMLIWNGTDGPHLLQYSVYMAVTMALCVVLRTFLAEMLMEQFRLERQLRKKAATDDLSGLLLRNRFLELAADAIDEAHVRRRPTCLLYLDVDHFKAINDDHGHAAGDAALVALAAALRAQGRPKDLIGRVGGEEFAMLLPGAGVEQALERAERLRLAVHDIPRPDGRLSVSIGVAACAPGAYLGVEALLARADQAMRHAKREGRDRIVIA
ncbi:MAG: diguanylate cyclase [Xanthomonadales bacterium]|nr:diguanylate cyclase [Xanthomonadales bacterium]